MRGRRFGLETSRPTPLGPEYNPWFWNPGLFGAQRAPEAFDRRLKDLDPDLEAIWNPIRERWAIWFRSPRVNHPICRGWRLLFIVEEPGSGRYLPLDERSLAQCYLQSGKAWRDGLQYFDAVMREAERDRMKKEAAEAASIADSAGDYFEFTKPRVGYGPLTGSKVIGQ